MSLVFKSLSALRLTRQNLMVWLGRVTMVLALAFASGTISPVEARAETRTLKLYFTHTQERATITFKRNGRYDQNGLKQLNRFLRDHRRNEPTKMDPQLFDIVWEAYQAVGARDYIHVVSGYRSPATNSMLRRTRGGQATKSKHMTGQAMDFFIPGVSSSKLREVGFKLQGGGVGYYPKSGTPYVHFDTGNVRAWPRMSRSQLTRLFPKGGTLHLPPDGKPLPGYQQALAEYKARKARGQATVNRGSSGGPKRAGNLLAAIFGGGADEEEDNAESATPSRAKAQTAPAPRAAPETPETLLAALPARSLPRPDEAPRINRGGGVPVAITPQEPVAVAAAPVPQTAPASDPAPVDAQPEPPTQTQTAVAAVTDYTPPVPGSRPAVLIARAETSNDDRRSAAEIESALSANDSDTQIAATDTSLADNAAERDAIVAALQQRPSSRNQLTNEDATRLALALPIPGQAPDRPTQDTGLPATAVAFAPPTREAEPEPSIAAAVSPSTRETALSKAARLPVPAQRAASQDEADRVMTASLTDTPVVTTSKNDRATAFDRQTINDSGAVLNVRQAPPPSPEMASRMMTASSVTNGAQPQGRPDFIRNAQRAAPQIVYAQGFSRDPLPGDTSRLSGSAVTFLAVAKFEGSGGTGGGQPLKIQVPAPN